MIEDRDVNVLVVVKGSERYVFLYTDARRAELMAMAARYAADAELSFSHYDLDVTRQRVMSASPGFSGC